MVRLSGWQRHWRLTTLHGYIYARWTDLYVRVGSQYIAPLLRRRGKRWLAVHYHGKVLPTDLARAIVSIDQEIPLRDLEQVIPYPQARDLVLAAPLDVAVYECPCRHLRAIPCPPTQVCMVIGQPFVDFMIEHHPGTSRRLTTQEAVDLLAAEHARGHVHTAWFKDASVGRFYAICNCCPCCCGGIEAMKKHGIAMITPSGYLAEIATAGCVGCGACAAACPFDALALAEGVAVVDAARCMGCGVCEDQCPAGAIALRREPAKGIPLDVRAMVASEHA
jgi:ferredoxin